MRDEVRMAKRASGGEEEKVAKVSSIRDVLRELVQAKVDAKGKGKGKGRQGMPPSREAGRRPPSTAQGSSGGLPARKYKKEGFGGVPSTSPNPPAFVGPFLPDTLTAIEAARKVFHLMLLPQPRLKAENSHEVRERSPIPGLPAEPEKAPAPSQSGAPSTSGASAGPSKHR